MILDKDAMFADDLAFGGTPTVINMGAAAPGKGEPKKIFVQGSSDLAGVTGFIITDGSTSAAADAVLTHTVDLVGNRVVIDLPSDIQQYVKIALAGTPSAGSWSAGFVLPGAQTNT